MKRYTGAEARALREAATAGPWHMEHASKAPPGDEWGEVVSRLHPAGGAGAPVPGMRLTWTRRGVGVLAERNARLIAAAPDLAATVEAMDAEIAELRATLAAERKEAAWLQHLRDGCDCGCASETEHWNRWSEARAADAARGAK